jgi:hypothetical protein
MGRVLAHYLRQWYKQTPYARPTDFVSRLFKGGAEFRSVPLYSAAFTCDQRLRKLGL